MSNREGFLAALAEEYFSEYGERFRNLAFVFPNRRSAVYFRHHLAGISDQPIWSPHIFSITDFAEKCSSLEIPETHELVFRLYDCYREIFPDRKMRIENFFQSGKIILSDLSEIDKNLVDTGGLFRSLEGLHGLEESARNIQSELKKEYLDFWADVDKVYRPFRETLSQKGMGYEGMVFRAAAEYPEPQRENKWEKVIFAGFNALSRAEEAVISELQNSGKGELIAEGDPYFTDDPLHEAGHFFRKEYAAMFNRIISPPEGGLKGKKNIRIVQATSGVAQTKFCGIRLKELIEKGEQPEDTALVFPDEGLMFPALNSLPDEIGKGNISMGYPLKQTPIYLLYDHIIELHAGADEKTYREDLVRVLEHPYIRMVRDPEAGPLLKQLQEETETFIERPSYSPSGILELLIPPIPDSLALIDRILAVINLIREQAAIESDLLSDIEKEFVFRFYSLAETLGSLIRDTGEPVSLTGFRKMFNDLVGTVHIPFSGEPLEGLQVLGVLEMQNLRFKNLFILSMNEDTFPSGKFSPTYIPQDVRREFHLPMHGEREAIYAYHFYRMLANSEHITLLYSGVSPGSGGGERSRFIDQLLMEYGEYNPNAEITRTTADFQLSIRSAEKISIRKNEDSLKRIRNRSYSPTALREWLVCPLRFWFRYILGIRDDDETDDASNPAKFGSISHKVLERLYQPKNGKEIEPEFFTSLSDSKLNTIIRESFNDNKVKETETGLNRITFEVIRELTARFIRLEKESSPFLILALEKKLKEIPFTFNHRGKEETIRLNGVIDRFDEKGGVPRIIDYKTGNTGSLDLKKGLIEADFIKQKELFQLLVYALMLKQTGELSDPFRLGVYPFRDLTQDLKFVRLKKGDHLSTELLDEFGEFLSTILSDLFDPEIPFTQTEDESHCRYCLHKISCQRALGDDTSG